MDSRSGVLRRTAAILVLLVNLFAFAACSSNGNGSISPTVVSRNTTTSGCTQYSNGLYCKVDGPACTGTCEYEVAGINDSRDIVGNYSNCTTTGSSPTCSSQAWSCNGTAGCQPCPLIGGAAKWTSYTSVYGNTTSPYSTYFNDQYPDAPQGQYMYAISNEQALVHSPKRLSTAPTPPPTIEVGCINSFGGSSGNQNGIWANEDNNGLWSEREKAGESMGCDNKPNFDATGELLGFDNTNPSTMSAVGFYDDHQDKNSDCDFRVWRLNPGGKYSTINVKFPSTTKTSETFQLANVMAMGITETNTSQGGEIVGTANGTIGGTSVQLAWLMTSATIPVHVYQCSNSTVTAFTGIAPVGSAHTLDIVGWCKHNDGTTHGFVAVYNGTGFTAQNIDEPNAKNLTVVNGINSKGDICGWYTDTAGNYHGFVGLGVVTALRKHRHHHLRTKHIASV